MSKKPPLTVEDILTAFRSRLTQPQRTMLKVLRDNSGSTATELAKKMGWDDWSVWDRRLSMMCMPRSRWLGSFHYTVRFSLTSTLTGPKLTRAIT